MTASTIYLNGKILTADEKTQDALHPWHLEGKGVFETMRSYQGRVFAFDEHMKRMRAGLKALKVDFHVSPANVLSIIEHLQEENSLGDARIRVTCWSDRIENRLSVICLPVRVPGQRVYRKGYRVNFSPFQRNPGRYSNIKSIDYALFNKAYAQANAHGFDEAVLLNRNREIVEGSRTNIFCVKKNVLYTPAIRCGCLKGITRGIVLKCAQSLNIPARKVVLKKDRLLRADEAFLTNSLLEIMPLTFVHRKKIGTGKPGPLTQSVMAAYKRLVTLEGTNV